MKPTEVRAVVELLEQEHEDVEELAKEVIKTLDRMRADDRLYVLLVSGRVGPLETWGPYPTAKQAVKGAQEATQGLSGASYRPSFLFRPGVGQSVDPERHLCPSCDHPSWTHGFPRGVGCAIQVGENPTTYCNCKESA